MFESSQTPLYNVCMADNPTFELPKPTDKLPFKFILDSLKDEMLKEPEPSSGPGEILTASAQEEVSPQVELPESKKFFRIGEVSELLGVESYVLRYWETEFRMIRPTKSSSGHRVYSRKDVQLLDQIRKLLHDEKFSIKGAKKQLLEARKSKPTGKTPPLKDQNPLLKQMASELRGLVQAARNSPGIF